MIIKKRSGFTLIELLVVIAIIGILAAVTLVTLQAANKRARTSNALSSLKSVQNVAVACVFGSFPLNAPSATNKICNDADVSNWPNISNTNFTYNSIENNGSTDFSSFKYSASSSDGKKITCDETNCKLE